MKVKKGLSFIDKLFFSLTCLLCLAILLCYLAPYVDPRTFSLLAFFGLAYPPLLLANLIVIIYWLLRRRWFFIIPLASILIGWNVLTNNIGFRVGSDDVARPPGNTIRIMTYNVHDFKRYGNLRDTTTKHGILELLNRQQPDIIGFEEYMSQKRGRFDMTDSLKRVLNTDYCYFESFTQNQRKATGMAIFSKYPIIAKGTVLLSDQYNENQCLYIDVKKDDKIFRFYSVHLKSIHFDPEDYNYLDSVSSKGKADLHSAKRVKDKLMSAFLKRSEQMFKIKADAAKCPYPYIIAGDFNDTPTSFAVNQMAKGLKNTFREKGSGLGRTYNGDFPNYQIDYIMASPQFDVASYKIIEKKLSDHYPVRSDLVLK